MIESIAPAFNTLLLFIVIGLQVILLLRPNGSGRIAPADWEKRIKHQCRIAIQAEKANLPFEEVRD